MISTKIRMSRVLWVGLLHNSNVHISASEPNTVRLKSCPLDNWAMPFCLKRAALPNLTFNSQRNHINDLQAGLPCRWTSEGNSKFRKVVLYGVPHNDAARIEHWRSPWTLSLILNLFKLLGQVWRLQLRIWWTDSCVTHEASVSLLYHSLHMLW